MKYQLKFKEPIFSNKIEYGIFNEDYMHFKNYVFNTYKHKFHELEKKLREKKFINNSFLDIIVSRDNTFIYVDVNIVLEEDFYYLNSCCEDNPCLLNSFLSISNFFKTNEIQEGQLHKTIYSNIYSTFLSVKADQKYIENLETLSEELPLFNTVEMSTPAEVKNVQPRVLYH